MSLPSMQEQIQTAASVLLGRAVWRCTRAADMACFQFGQRRNVRNFRGDEAQVGEYALHLQCSWRIVKQDQIIVAAFDVFRPREGHETEDGLDFNWEAGNLLDDRIRVFFENDSRQYTVEDVQAGRAGALRLILEGEFSFEICPCNSQEKLEHWRLFEPRSDRDHLVVTGTGIGELAD